MTEPDRLHAELDRLRRENEAQAAELAESRRRSAVVGAAIERADAREREGEAARGGTAAAHAGALAAGRAELAASEARGERLRDENAELEASRAALARSEAYVRAMLESSTDYAIVAADPEGRITEWNAGARAIMDWERDEVLGRNAALFYTPEDRAADVPGQEMRTALAEGRATNERWHLKRDGTRFWASGLMMPLRDGAGAAIGFLKVLRDRTERRRIEEALREGEAALRRVNETLEARVSERTAELSMALDRLREEALERERAEDALRQSQKMEAVGQLTGGIAHDFNNMLQGIGGALDLMQRRLERGRADEAECLVEVAQRGVARAAALTHRLLAFARRQALDPKPVDADALVRDVEELIRRAVGPGIAVEARSGDGERTVLCDANGLENALLNLAINARDAMPDGGTLTIATGPVRLSRADVADQDGAAPGEYVEVRVSDTGAGMTPEVAARAFEPFFTTKPVGQGTGLGLSQIYGFVRQSGGLVRIESAPGRGTTVRIFLPRHVRRAPGSPDACVWGAPTSRDAEGEAAAETGMPERAEARAGAGGTVLLVEDEPAVREVTAEVLRERGHRVLEAGDGPAGLRLLAAGRVDLLVTDVGLPGGLNGRQVAEIARERRPGLPVLFITGYAGGVLDGRLAPGTEVLGKPFKLDALAGKVRDMIEAGATAPAGRNGPPVRPGTKPNGRAARRHGALDP